MIANLSDATDHNCYLLLRVNKETCLHLPARTSPLTASRCPTLASAQELEVEPDVDRERDRDETFAFALPLLLSACDLKAGGGKSQSSCLRFRSAILQCN